MYFSRIKKVVMEKIRVIITGSTGMVGEGVLFECLNHPLVEKVLVVNRKSCGIVHEKLKEIIHDDFYDFNSIPSAGKKFSKHSKYSCVAPGPPFNNSNFIWGLFPNRLVQTLNLPFGVSIEITFIPPVCTPESVAAK